MNDIPAAIDMLRELIKAGGTLPQSHFGDEWNDAGDFCFLNGLTDNSPNEISITPKGARAVEELTGAR